jgi:hypothetical protein
MEEEFTYFASKLKMRQQMIMYDRTTIITLFRNPKASSGKCAIFILT